jgi:hypothetical protein
MEDLSLHILDIVENSIQAKASRIMIRIVEDLPADLLTIEIVDNGKGMDPDVAAQASDPFYTTRTTRKVGLGLSLLQQSAKEADGAVEVFSKTLQGVRIVATFTHSHIDRKPIGAIADTLTMLIAGNPHIDFFFEHLKTGYPTYQLDAKTIKEELGDIPINCLDVLQAIKNDIEDELIAKEA